MVIVCVCGAGCVCDSGMSGMSGCVWDAGMSRCVCEAGKIGIGLDIEVDVVGGWELREGIGPNREG